MAKSGDTLPIILNYYVNDEPIEDADLDEIEFSLGGKTYTLTGDDITLDATLGKYVLFIGKNDTAKLLGAEPVQARFTRGTDIASSDIDYIMVGASLFSNTTT